MSNILNHNRILIDFMLSGEDYWDFHLSEEMGYGGTLEGLSTECLSAYIDFNDPDCIFWDDTFSKSDYIWKNAINEGVLLDYIGVTGVDNGLITYQKDRITNKEFLDIFLHSTYETEANDMRLHMRKVNGNNQIYDYSNNITRVDNKDVAELKGGFYQGFFKLYGKQYQVLPYAIENGWSLEVKLKKSNLENQKYTINDAHPQNKGIFLYIGTRAENKWWEKYLVEQDFNKSQTEYNADDYFEQNYTTESEDVNSSFIQEDEPQKKEYDYLENVYGNNGEDCKEIKCDFIDKEYVQEGYSRMFTHNCNQYVDEEYIEGEEEITGNETLLTSDGFNFNQPNIIQYETDNKFLLFNRTPEGFTTKNWEEGTKVTMYDIKKPDIGNYFELFNRTPNGYTTKTIGKLIEQENKKYNVLKDIYRNALAFQIRDDGSIGFKYMVKDCEAETEQYKIEELFSKENIIHDDEWYTISIKIVPTRPKIIENPLCDNLTTSTYEEMKIYIYVNGCLKLKSDALPILNLKALNDLSDKQQGVPYCLSLGGGTQGLCDVVNINYREIPKYALPLENEFCGSFVGYIQSFRFYDCPLNFTEIQENYKYDINI